MPVRVLLKAVEIVLQRRACALGAAAAGSGIDHVELAHKALEPERTLNRRRGKFSRDFEEAKLERVLLFCKHLGRSSGGRIRWRG